MDLEANLILKQRRFLFSYVQGALFNLVSFYGHRSKLVHKNSLTFMLSDSVSAYEIHPKHLHRHSVPMTQSG